MKPPRPDATGPSQEVVAAARSKLKVESATKLPRFQFYCYRHRRQGKGSRGIKEGSGQAHPPKSRARTNRPKKRTKKRTKCLYG